MRFYEYQRPGHPRVTLLYKPYGCVLPLRVGFLRLFGQETGIHFAHFGQESGMFFEGTTGVYERNYRFNSKNKSEIETREFDMHLKNSFVCALI